jgi:nitrate/TMAO reductase-like tetraheme cytochrome c subunit
MFGCLGSLQSHSCTLALNTLLLEEFVVAHLLKKVSDFYAVLTTTTVFAGLCPELDESITQSLTIFL